MPNKRQRNAQKRKNKGKIEAHKKEGTNLIAPFNQIPNLAQISWLNDRLPCMLWAALLINGIGRDKALEVFRNIGLQVGSLFGENENWTCNLPRVGLYGLSTIDNDLQDIFFAALFSTEDVKKALLPLKLINQLPLSNKWHAHLTEDLTDESAQWTILAESVSMILDHQSQEATDCRWAYCIPIVNSGKFHLQTEEQLKELAEYPHYEDQRRVRPTIRSIEMNFGSSVMNEEYLIGKKDWSRSFWDECKAKTDCFSSIPNNADISYDVRKTTNLIQDIWVELSSHFAASDEFTHVQPKRDASFGFCFYSITLAQEAIATSGRLTTSKIALRMLAEIYITFSYLISVGDDKLWTVYRAYGSGQAKLAFLKLQEVLVNEPGYIKKETIESLANEDMYMDFQDINLGNWAKIDLRKMSLVAGCKEVYDAYYTWPSTYVHGQWCAIRDVVFTTCYNPLHRLHRIPLPSPRYEDGSEEDIVILLNKILDLLDDLYPRFEKRAGLIKNTE